MGCLEKRDPGSSIACLSRLSLQYYPVALAGFCPSISPLGGLVAWQRSWPSPTHISLFSSLLGRPITLENAGKQSWTLISGLTRAIWAISSFLFLLNQSQAQTFAHSLWSSKTGSRTRRKWGQGHGRYFSIFSQFSSLVFECWVWAIKRWILFTPMPEGRAVDRKGPLSTK